VFVKSKLSNLFNSKGFTLVEIMIVMSILAIILSTVSLASRPNVSRQLKQDSEYLGDVLDFIGQEAQIRGKSLLITIDNNGIRTNANSNQNILGRYRWSIDKIEAKSGWINKNNIWYRIITTEPIQSPFNIHLIKDNHKIQLIGDGSGRYKVSSVIDLRVNNE